MAQSSWPSPDTAHVVNDSQYERLGVSYGAIAGLIGTPGSTHLCFADATGLQVKLLGDRYAQVRGFTWYSGASTFAQAIASNSSGSTRTDLIVLRLSRTTWNVTVAVVQGSPGAGAPAVTQNSGSTGVWELPIGLVNVTSGASTIQATDVTPISLWIAADGSGYQTHASSISALNTVLGYVPGAVINTRVTNVSDGIEWIYTGSAWRNTTPDVRTFFSPGSFMWNKPAGAKTVRVVCRGAGGGGGGAGAAASGSHAGGAGGGQGAYAESWFSASSLPSSAAVVVGAGGSAGSTSGGNGGNGASTTFNGTTVVAPGGLFGEGDTTNTAGLGVAGGLGGTGAVGDIALGGQGGTASFGLGNLGTSGTGGGEGGGVGRASSGTGNIRPGFAGIRGGGGSGGLTTAGSGAGAPGGAGGDGWCTVTTFFV